jgi:hypothetical protein
MSTDTELTQPTATDSMEQKDNPNTQAILQLIDKLNGFVTQSKELRTNLQQSFPGVTLDLATLKQNINLEPKDSPTLPLLQKYQTLLEEFEKIKSALLTKAAETFGLDGSDYLVAPLGKLLDQIQTGQVDTNLAIQQLNQLIRTIGIAKMINYSRMIPYVGAVIYGVIKGLDSYTATQVVLGKFLQLLENLGVNKDQLDLIRNYVTKKTFVTENYVLFQKWLAEGAPFNIFPNIFQTFANTQQQFSNQVSHIFIPPKETPEEIGEEQPMTGGLRRIADQKNMHRKKTQTKKEIQNIHRSIKQHLSRLRTRCNRGRCRSSSGSSSSRTLRTPLHKSIAPFKIKRSF